MTPADSVARGREALRRKAWAEAYALLLAAQREVPLEAEDLGRLALAAYLVAHGLASERRPVVVEQGHTMGRPSRIEVRLSGGGVRVCGTAVVVLEGRLKQ